MKKIKLSFPYPEFPIIRQTPKNSGEWGDYKFYINQDIEECDYWVVFNSLLTDTEQTRCSPINTIFVTAEPFSIGGYNPAFVNQFSRIITCQREIKHPDVTYLPQAQPWHVGFSHSQHDALSTNKNYDELKSLGIVPKSKELSLVASNKQFTSGHKKRYEFVMAIKKHFGDRVDLFGRGIKDFDDKWEVLAPYKYSLAVENSAYDDYITEKLFDCYLADTVPFYYGAPNVNKYFSPNAYVKIDIDAVDDSIATIERVLDDPYFYENHLPAIRDAKNKSLDEYNLFPLIVNFIEGRQLNSQVPKELIILKQNPFSLSYFAGRVLNKLKKIL